VTSTAGEGNGVGAIKEDDEHHDEHQDQLEVHSERRQSTYAKEGTKERHFCLEVELKKLACSTWSGNDSLRLNEAFIRIPLMQFSDASTWRHYAMILLRMPIELN
jgi:hypothetical protein